MRNRVLKYRLILLISLCIVVSLGYWVRFSGPFPEPINDALGSIAYEMVWVFVLLLLFPQVSPVRAAIIVFLATCFLEFLQLWQPTVLKNLRATALGRLILGTTFTWTDLPAYAVGSALGGLWSWTAFWFGASHRHK